MMVPHCPTITAFPNYRELLVAFQLQAKQFIKVMFIPTGAFQRPEDLPADDSRRNYPRYQGEAFYKVNYCVDSRLHLTGLWL